MPLETLGLGQRAVAGIRRIEWMYRAVLRRDVQNADLLAGAVFIGVCAHNDRRAGHERLPAEAVHQRLGDREALAFDQHLFPFGALGLDDQIHVRVLPIEPRDLAFDQYLLGRVKQGLAVMRERRHAEGRSGGENKNSHGSDSHVETSWQAIARLQRSTRQRTILTAVYPEFQRLPYKGAIHNRRYMRHTKTAGVSPIGGR